jgi:hypothetical protein
VRTGGGGRSRLLLVSASAAILVAAGLAIALFAFNGVIRPHLVSDTIRAHGAVVQVRYVFNEPVHALLIVNGKPATAVSPLRKSGALLWRRPNQSKLQLAIQGTDRAGRRALVRL